MYAGLFSSSLSFSICQLCDTYAVPRRAAALLFATDKLKSFVVAEKLSLTVLELIAESLVKLSTYKGSQDNEIAEMQSAYLKKQLVMSH